MFYTHCGLVWFPYSSFPTTPHLGGKSVNCWFTAVGFKTRKQLLEKEQVPCSPPTQIWYVIYEITLLSHPGWETSSRRWGKGMKPAESRSGWNWELYLFGKWSKTEALALRQTFLSPGMFCNIRFGGHSLLWTSNAAFCPLTSKLPWPQRGVGEGFGFSKLKLALADTIRIHFMNPGGLEESAWKNILSCHRIPGAINEFGKNLDVNAYCPCRPSQKIAVSMT